jgi:hypothetical protein
MALVYCLLYKESNKYYYSYPGESRLSDLAKLAIKLPFYRAWLVYIYIYIYNRGYIESIYKLERELGAESLF